MLEHLRGERDLAETIQLVKHRTHQFARRQETWFRGLSECRWIEMRAEVSAAEIAEQILTQAATN